MSLFNPFSGPGPDVNVPTVGGSSSLAGISSSLGGLIDPSKARLAVSGLASRLVGPTTKKSQTTATWLGQNGKNGQIGPTGDNTDWRVTVSLANGLDSLYQWSDNNMLAPLLETSGVVFPITPMIQTTHNAKYSTTSLTHSNYAMQFYEGSEVAAININGEFPIQNIEEGQYLLAVIYFFRAATKMYWGGTDINAGAPPPMLYLNGYGQYYFPNVPCVLTSFMHTLPDDKDYIEIPSLVGGTSTRLPTQSTIQIILQPIYSRASVAQFDLEDFANGNMVTGANGTNLNGGFI
jgi:hypothetical protein